MQGRFTITQLEDINLDELFELGTIIQIDDKVQLSFEGKARSFDHLDILEFVWNAVSTITIDVIEALIANWLINKIGDKGKIGLGAKETLCNNEERIKKVIDDYQRDTTTED